MDALGKKLLALLEKNVEWLAIALAVAFLGWMLYGYVFQKPVTATVAGTQLTPGEVDPKVLDGPAALLREAMASQAVPPQLHAPEDFVADLEHRLNPAAQTIVALAAPWTTLPTPPDFFQLPTEPKEENGNPVTQLPVAAAPEDLKVEQGRSNVELPPPPAAVAAGAQPANPIVQLANNQGTPTDRNWVSISAMIRTKPLADELNKDQIPPELKRITILRVEMVRQELDANGNWGDEHTIGTLPTVDIPPLPEASAGPLDQINYINWAEKPDSQQALLQPPFYTVLQADAWVVPGLPQPAGVGQLANLTFDPATYTGDRDDLPPDEQKILDDYRKQQAAEKAAEAKQRAAAAQQRAQQQRQQNYGPPGGMGGPPGGFGGGRPDVNDADRPMTLAQAYVPGGPPPGWRPPGAPPGWGMPPGMRPPGMPMPPTPGQTPVDVNNPLTNAASTLPQGAFDPNTQPDIVCWAHDDTVAPGKTYRYQIHYVIKNPVFQTTNVAKPQSLADQFDITSASSKWTDPISVKAETNLFAVSASPLRNWVPVRFEIYRWKDGLWQRQTVEAEPGDTIGSIDPKTKTNFETGLTLVDVHPDPRNIDDKIITLTTESGQLLQHDLNADRNNPDHKKLNATVNSEPKPGATPANGSPGAPANGAAGQAPSASAAGEQ